MVSSTGSRPLRHRKLSQRGRSWRPDPSDPGSFDYLLQSKHGAVDVVPEVSGTYDELITRAARLDIGGVSFWVESVEDLLATLTVPRRAKDRERVERLRAIQRGVRAD